MLTAKRSHSLRNLLSCLFLLLSIVSRAQTPGWIVNPAGGAGTTPLNPNGDAYTSKTSQGFTTSDVGSFSEIPYKSIPPIISEPTGDLLRGPSTQFSDLVHTTDDESGLYVYNDGINLLFRMRLGGIVSGSKGYSVLIDADEKFGASGTNADPNYKPATTGSNGNPGFELEIVLETNFQISIYDVDGKEGPSINPIKTFPIGTYSQISLALSNVSNTPDYFYDFYVPLSELKYSSGTKLVTATTPIRLSATTVMSPQGAIGGPKSDIFGVTDADYMTAWETAINAQPSFKPENVTSTSSNNTTGSVCTAPPIVNSPIALSATTISGTWTKATYSTVSTATISVYKNGTLLGNVPTSVASGGSWNFSVSGLQSGDLITAKAQGTNESMCLFSNTVQVVNCTPATRSASPTVECFSDKGADGSGIAGATIKIYRVTSTGISVDGTIVVPSTGLWSWAGPGSTGSTSKQCGTGSPDVLEGTYYVTQTELGKCESLPGDNTSIVGTTDFYTCAGTSNITIPPVISQDVIYSSSTTISGTAPNPSTVRLYINNELKVTINSTGTFSFPISSYYLNIGDSIQIRAQEASKCWSSVSKGVSCFIPAPTINTITNGTTTVAVGSQLSGISSLPGSKVTIYNSATNTVIGTADVSVSGTWTLTSPVVASGTSYFARHTGYSCGVGAASPIVTAAVQTSSARCGTINDVTETGSSPVTTPNTVTGTLNSAVAATTVNLYQGGVLLGTTSTSNTTWSIQVNTITSGTSENMLYVGGELTIGIKEGTNAEFVCSAKKIVTCLPISAPALTQTSFITTNSFGQIEVKVNSSLANVVYTLEDASSTTISGNTIYVDRSQSVYGNGATITLTSYPFTSAQTYNLRVSALKLNNPTCLSFTTVTLTVTDKDGDSKSDAMDLDDDNDGISDTVESGGIDPLGDADGDGILNYLDKDLSVNSVSFTDVNNDGINDVFDADRDGIINSFDLDSDNDGIPDLVEAGGVDINGDGRVDYTGTFASNDSDNDGLINIYDATAIANLDTDDDGVKNFLDLDSDNDGIPDVVEVGGVDANGDGRLDNFSDSDGDGFDSRVDGDANGDGTAENTANALLVTGADNNADGKPDTYPQGIANTDGGGLPNPYDLDSDNDGLPDIIEAGGADNDNNGKVDVFADTDKDGFADSRDGDVGNDGTSENLSNVLIPTGADANSDGKADSYSKANADGGSLPNPYDLDSDDDGVPDLIEQGGVDSNGDGMIDVLSDADGNGWQNSYDPTQSGINLKTLDANGAATGGNVFDFDGDGVANYLDLDSDNDGIPDIIEQGGTDSNNDGKLDGVADVDTDGFIDVADPLNSKTGAVLGTAIITTGNALNAFNIPSSYSSGDNFDLTGLINMQDLDADGDGILDTKEAGLADSNNDGLADGTLGGDGWSDMIDALTSLSIPNSDGTSKSNFLDIDSDDDGITDNVEGQTTSGYILPSGSDDDLDGIDNAYDNNDALFGGAANNGIAPNNHDGADQPDYTDTDTDNDGDADRIEGNDLNGNGKADDTVTLSGSDTDGDGLDDVFENDGNKNNGPVVTIAGFGGVGGKSPAQKTPTSASERDWRNSSFTLTSSAALPVHFVSISASKQSNGVQVVWTVSDEQNVKMYEVEKSTNGSRYTKIGEVAFKTSTSGINKYQYYDASIVSNTVFYRIRQVDHDGKFMFSSVVSVSANEIGSKLTVYPNPLSTDASVVIGTKRNQKTMLIMCDMQGKILGRSSVELLKGQNVIPGDSFIKLPGGTYILMAEIDGALLQTRFVKQ